MRRWRRWSWSICCRRFDSKGDAVPLRYAPGSGETGGDNPLSSARRTRPRRHGAGRGVKVRYTPRLLRGILCGALRCACPACSDFVGMRQEIAPLLGVRCPQRGAKRHAFGVPLFNEVFRRKTLKPGGVYLGFYTAVRSLGRRISFRAAPVGRGALTPPLPRSGGFFPDCSRRAGHSRVASLAALPQFTF